MNRLFELFGEIGIKGADAVDSALDNVDQKAQSLGDRLESTGARMERFGGQVSDVGGRLSRTLTPAIGAATAALGFFARAKANSADETNKAARAAGVAADFYQKMNFAMGQVTSFGESEFQRMLRRTTQALADARNGSESKTQALMEMGFAQEDIAAGAITTEQALRGTLSAIENAETQAEATGIAMEMFGQRLGPLLSEQIRQSRGELERWMETAEDTGGIMSEELLDAGERFNDMLAEQALRFQGVGNTLAESLLPALEELIPVLVDKIIPAMEIGIGILTRLVEGFAALPEPVQTAVVGLLALAAAAGPVLFVLGKLIAMTGALLPLLPVVAKVVAVLGALWAIIQFGKALIEGVIQVLKWLGEGISSLIPTAEEFAEFWESIWQGIAAATQRVVQFIHDQTIGRMQALWDGIKQVLEQIKQGFMAAFQWVYDQTIGRVKTLVDRVLGLARGMWRALTGNSIIPDMVGEAVQEFTKLADSAGAEGERMRDGLTDAARNTDVGLEERGRGGEPGGGGRAMLIDMSHSVFRDDRDMLDRLRRSGADMTGAFS